ncbi:hypothetical protein BT63DRAFT_460011 [Microthyrium microscopicum]|uniref:Heterokaryon incompatibility domain-containing protein n=1 Tax=Microthyrium microscopicum TaxID=703497 RepID=A0A6A6TYW8_9PEZI|nr:hypothetical protein BT63DRAFT_460011 [Microthyrium microscopicum]
MASKFQHVSLSPGRKARIVYLQPSTEFDSPIHCHLKEFSLDRPQATAPYEALSYVWGNTAETHKIQCDGQPLFVTYNCSVALRYLRHMTRERALWVDCICINQFSNTEKSNQVKVMGEIYQNAQRVLVWLGEGNEEITKLIRKLRFKGSFLSSFYRGKVPSSFGLRPFSKDMKSPAQQAFVSVLEHDWFKRAWTLQESSVATHIIILYGTIGLEWNQFVFCVHYWSSSFSRHVWRPMSAIRSREMYQARLHGKEKSSPNSRPPTRGQLNLRNGPDFGVDPSKTASINGVALLQLSIFRAATDPRDKIYALHHMLTSVGVKMQDPDYDLAPQSVYEQVTVALIESSQSLWILENVFSPQRMPGLPSWVPDFSQETAPHELLNDYQHFFDGYSPSVASQSRLILDGKIIHLIKTVAERIPTPQTRSNLNINLSLEGGARCIARWAALALNPRSDGTIEQSMRNLCLNLLHPNFEDNTNSTQRRQILEDGFDGFLDTIRRCYDSKPKPPFKRSILKNSTTSIIQGQAPDHLFSAIWKESMPPASKALVDAMITGGLGQRLFCTSNETFGLCQTDIKPDDLVVLFPGTTAPMILRCVGENFRLVGRASIFGIEKSAWPHRHAERGMETFTLV